MQRIVVDGRQVAFARGGSGQIELLFVHGIRNAAWVWNPTTSRLDPDRFRWLAFDLPGCGESETPPAWSGCTVQDNAALLLAIADRCCEQPPVLVGHSLGGAIVTQAALDRPGSVAGTVLVAPAPLDGLAIALDELLAGAFAAESDVEDLGRSAFSVEPSAEDFARLVDTVRMARPAHIEGALRSIHALSMRGRLRELPGPSLVIGGDEDRHVSPRETYLTAAALRHPKVQIWSGVGHVPHWEKPDEFADLIARFATER